MNTAQEYYTYKQFTLGKAATSEKSDADNILEYVRGGNGGGGEAVVNATFRARSFISVLPLLKVGLAALILALAPTLALALTAHYSRVQYCAPKHLDCSFISVLPSLDNPIPCPNPNATFISVLPS
jgi:hypothetical protein